MEILVALAIFPAMALATGVLIMVKGRRWWWLGLVLTILGALGVLAAGYMALLMWSMRGWP